MLEFLRRYLMNDCYEVEEGKDLSEFNFIYDGVAFIETIGNTRTAYFYHLDGWISPNPKEARKYIRFKNNGTDAQYYFDKEAEIQSVALKVVLGVYGNGSDRVKQLKGQGFNGAEIKMIQNTVNKRVKPKKEEL